MLKIIYGLDVDDENHEIIRTVEESLQGTGQVFVPGKYLVDLIPALEYVPEWVPGAGFQTQFARWREVTIQAKEMPYQQRNPGHVSIYTISMWNIPSPRLLARMRALVY